MSVESDGYRFLSVPVGNASEFVVDKEKSCREFATYFMLRVMKMFHYDNLPEEIPVDCMEKMLLTNGFLWFTKWNSTNQLGEHKNQFYVFHGRMGSVIDAYYRPTGIIIANPGANCYKEFLLNKQAESGTYYGDEGVIIRNDTLYHGLMPLIARYAYLLAENVLTMHTADVFLRIISLISAQDDKTLLSANAYINAITEGKMLAVADSKFFDGVKLQAPPSNNGSYLTQFIEYQQYFLGSFFNEIGLNANFNMKRESIAKSESSLNEDSMLPLCQNMLMCRQADFDVVNKMYGLNIKVSFDSAWLQNALEILFELNAMRKEGGVGEAGGDSKAASELVNEGESNDKTAETDLASEAGKESEAEREGISDESSGESKERTGEKGDGEERAGEERAGKEEKEGGNCSGREVKELVIRATGLDIDEENLDGKTSEELMIDAASEGGDSDDREKSGDSTGSGDLSEE